MWSYDNDFARNVIIFDDTLSSHTDNKEKQLFSIT